MVIRNVSCPFLFHIKSEKHWKQYLTNASVSSKYRVEPDSIKSNDDIFNWLSFVRNVKLLF